MEYGEGATDDYDNNLRGKPIKIYDGAGLVEIPLYDFKGASLQSIRTYVDDYTAHPDWTTTSSVTMETDTYTTATTYDALGRPETITTPDGGITTYTYNQTGLLFSVAVTDVGSISTPLTTDIINGIYYDAKGQREKVKYENGVTTTYEYDPNTFRIIRILTTRNSDSTVLQDLNYWYDPVGNITWQTDDALDVIFYDGTMAAPENKYTYDALYRLIICNGREHASASSAINYNDGSRVGNVPLPSDSSAMRRYVQSYRHDEVGNMTQMAHSVSGAGSWTRNFTISTTTNHTTGNSIGSNSTTSETYTYDNRGNIISGFNHLVSLSYNDENRLQEVDVTSSITTYYQYDHNGQRVRKVKEDTGSSYTHVRKYIGGWELYQKLHGGTPELERETLHIMDDAARVAIIDTPTYDATSSGEVQTLRYQYSNHLGTASLELDDAANIISYEEYYPFGNTSYQAGHTSAEVSRKRYRYIGKERDEETGFYYMGVRYYCPWLARWLAVDPINSECYNMCKGVPQRNKERDFLELTASGYEYCYANPIRWIDATGEQATPAQIETESGALAARLGQKTGQDNLQPQAKPLNTGKDYIPSTPLEKGLAGWYAAHPGQALPSGGTNETMSESRLQKMTPDERKVHEQVREQKLELAGYKPNGEPTGATKLAQNKHWQGLANNVILPTLDAASVLEGVSAVRNFVAERHAFSILKRMEANTPGAHFVSRHGAQTTLPQQLVVLQIC